MLGDIRDNGHIREGMLGAVVWWAAADKDLATSLLVGSHETSLSQQPPNK